jgi:hydrogenase/urease accessory protein HupE
VPLTLLALAAALLAHDEGSSSSEIRIAGNEVVWTVDVGTLGLQRVMDLGAPPHLLTREKLEPFRERIARYVGGGLTVEINGRPVAAEPGSLEAVYELIPPTEIRVLAKVRQTYFFRSPVPVERVTLGFGVFCDLVPNHRAVMTVSWDGRTREYVLYGKTELKVRPETLDTRWWSPVGAFFLWGIHHIFLGLDHVVFLLALLLCARGIQDIVKVATSFTAAHSLTLLLSALEVIRIPVRVTESLIALSIIYVAVENYFLKDGRHRWMLAFGFGLVHGLGFSSSLRDLLTDRIVVPVLAFNGGIEAGQLAILSVAYPLLRLLQGSSDAGGVEIRRRRLVLAGSLPILLLGMGWLIERSFGLAFMPV